MTQVEMTLKYILVYNSTCVSTL